MARIQTKGYKDMNMKYSVVHFDVSVRITSRHPPFQDGRRVEANMTLHSFVDNLYRFTRGVRIGSISKAIQRGLDDLSTKIHQELSSAGNAAEGH